jgi:hypothetical protein
MWLLDKVGAASPSVEEAAETEDTQRGRVKILAARREQRASGREERIKRRADKEEGEKEKRPSLRRMPSRGRLEIH